LAREHHANQFQTIDIVVNYQNSVGHAASPHRNGAKGFQ
jgi:hypothetical protein